MRRGGRVRDPVRAPRAPEAAAGRGRRLSCASPDIVRGPVGTAGSYQKRQPLEQNKYQRDISYFLGLQQRKCRYLIFDQTKLCALHWSLGFI